MNLFKSLLFLEAYVPNPSSFDDEFGPSYGNQRASGRAFRDGFTQPEFARQSANSEPCSLAGCG